MKHLLAALLLCLTVAAGAAPLPATGTVEVLFTPWDDAEGAILRIFVMCGAFVGVTGTLLGTGLGVLVLGS